MPQASYAQSQSEKGNRQNRPEDAKPPIGFRVDEIKALLSFLETGRKGRNVSHSSFNPNGGSPEAAKNILDLNKSRTEPSCFPTCLPQDSYSVPSDFSSNLKAEGTTETRLDISGSTEHLLQAIDDAERLGYLISPSLDQFLESDFATTNKNDDTLR